MRTKEYDRCRRFEERYGNGAILDIIRRKQEGETLKNIVEYLSSVHPISEGQLVQYLKTFIETFFYPSDQVKKYYYIKSKLPQSASIDEIMADLNTIRDDSKIIYTNFSKTSGKFARNRA